MDINYNRKYLTVTYAKDNLYAVMDRKKHKYLFTSPSKSEMIAKAQELQGFSPVDGRENTYGLQTGFCWPECMK